MAYRRRYGIDLTPEDREKIRLHRLMSRKTQKDIADALGRSVRWVVRIEHGGPARLRIGDLYRLAAFLKVPKAYLVGR